jgi:hypothetical protein
METLICSNIVGLVSFVVAIESPVLNRFRNCALSISVYLQLFSFAVTFGTNSMHFILNKRQIHGQRGTSKA